MKTRYYLWTSRVAAGQFRLEAIFNSEDSLEAYVKVEESKVAGQYGRHFYYRVDTVQIEE